MRKHNIEILEILEKSFRYGAYIPYRRICLIDVKMVIDDNCEIVTLSFYQSSGNNQVKGVWYPIVGINVEANGKFEDFRGLANTVRLTGGCGRTEGWIAKSPFFFKGNLKNTENLKNGFSYGKYYDKFVEISDTITYLMENGLAKADSNISIYNKQGKLNFNDLIYNDNKLYNNKNSQRANFEAFIKDTLFEVQESLINSCNIKEDSNDIEEKSDEIGASLDNPRKEYNLRRIEKINSVLLNSNLSFRKMIDNFDDYEEDVLLLSGLVYGMAFSKTDDKDYKEFLKSREIFFDKVNSMDGGLELFPQLQD